MNIFGPLVAEKYENDHGHMGIFVTRGHLSDIQVLWASRYLVTSGYFSDKC